MEKLNLTEDWENDDFTDPATSGGLTDTQINSEESVLNLLGKPDSYTIEYGQEIPLTKIELFANTKDIRKETIGGLGTSIRKAGKLFKPIDVLEVGFVDSETSERSVSYYVIDGARRFFGVMQNRDKFATIPATVWRFKNEQLAVEIASLLSVILNKTQQHFPQETWELYMALELEHGVTGEEFESLVSLEPGDASKLKSVMTTKHEEARDAYLTKGKSLEQAFKIMVRKQKEEDAANEEIDVVSGMAVSEAEEGQANTPTGYTPLSEDEARRVLNMDFSDEELTEDSFSEVIDDSADDEEEDSIENYVHYQKVGERERINPELKKAVFERDKLTCQLCLEGGTYKLPELVFHHKIPVHAGGADSMENGVTLCCNCHLQLHFFERNEKFEGDFKAIPESEREKFKRIMQMAKIAIEAGKLKYKDPKERKKQALHGISYPMPGADMKLKREVMGKLKEKE